MKVVFRVDASLRIGSGHVMRCLTLATALREAGAECRFLCREHEGHLAATLRARGFDCRLLPAPPAAAAPAADGDYAAWLGVEAARDADECVALLAADAPADWLVVDHYALGADWERRLRPHCRHLLAIDDLVREHDCDLLLDQNLGRDTMDYAGRVPAAAIVLTGLAHALLRPEFARARAGSLARRAGGGLHSLLVTMGGVDLDNATGAVLQRLTTSPLPPACRLTVVMGASAPWLAQVRALAAALPWPCDVRVDVSDMAALTAACDLAIGAAGSTAWERCCLGVPAALVVLADNQRPIAEALAAAGACWPLGRPQDLAETLPAALNAAANPVQLAAVGARAARIVDGLGCTRVVAAMRALP